MRTVFHCKLVNAVFGDPALYVSMRHERRAFLFDLGQIDALTPREILALSDVFVTHCHIDHFIGFDRLLRVCLGRPNRVRMFGPPGFVDNVACRLGGYLWNLAERYDEGLELEVMEIDDEATRTVTFRLVDAFRPSSERVATRPDGLILDEDLLCVESSVLDHKTPCLGFSLSQKQHIGIKKNRLSELGLPVGKWLHDVKAAILAELPKDTVYEPVPGKFITLGELEERCLVFRPGQRLAYVTDIGFTDDNIARVERLARDVDTLYIESSFRASDV